MGRGPQAPLPNCPQWKHCHHCEWDPPADSPGAPGPGQVPGHRDHQREYQWPTPCPAHPPPRPCPLCPHVPGCLPSFPQTCQVINDTAMLCKAPGIFLGRPQPQAQGEHPDEFGFLLDHVQTARSLNRSSFTYYPDPSFEPLGPSGVLDVKPGSHVVLKVRVGHRDRERQGGGRPRLTVSPTRRARI